MRWSTGQGWDAGYRHGRLAFLHRPEEQARLDEIAGIIGSLAARHGPCEVVDIGCGEGLLIGRLAGSAVVSYVGVDLSQVALGRLPQAPFPVRPVCAALGKWDGAPVGQAPRILVASEVLYYDPESVAHLERLVKAAPATVAAIVSCVAGKPDKPNWQEASARLWAALAKTGWPVCERRRPAKGDLAWDIVAYDLARPR